MNIQIISANYHNLWIWTLDSEQENYKVMELQQKIIIMDEALNWLY